MSKKLYKKAIKDLGKPDQVIRAIEELGELTQGLARWLNGKEDNVEEELADVTICLEVLMLIFDKDEVERIKKQKLDRMKTRLSGADTGS